MESPVLDANYEVLNKMTDLVEAGFKVLPSAIEAALILENKLAECGFSLDNYEVEPEESSDNIVNIFSTNDDDIH
jgi:hypothetical protein|tara:strand:- start:433 stop:657 length:225 start_codon:yes stop_codon:yes gene_type:complete